MLKRAAIFILVSMLFLPFISGFCEESAEWIYEPDTGIGSEVWAYLCENDEALSNGASYQPMTCLASDRETEAWLVRTKARSEEGRDTEENGFLLIYVQLDPSPKIIGSIPIAMPPEQITPTCEIKLLLDSRAVLDDENHLNEKTREAFLTGDEYQTIGAVYLDTEARDFLNSGWVNRIRVKEGSPKYTLTYKKRYKVMNNDLDAALADARADGFSLYDTQFPAEVDWGYGQMTLSFSADVSIITEEMQELCLPERSEAVQMITDHMPSEEKNQRHEDRNAEQAPDLEYVGPICFQRYTGSCGETSVRIEIWPIPDGEETVYLVELSAASENMKEAGDIRAALMECLDGMGILLHTDALKTQLIMRN